MNGIKSCVNIQGQNVIDELTEGVLQLRDLIEIGDVKGLSIAFENTRAPGLKYLAQSTSDACLQRTLSSASDIASFAAFLLQCNGDPNVAAEIVCNTLNYNAQQINSCSASAAYILLV